MTKEVYWCADCEQAHTDKKQCPVCKSAMKKVGHFETVE